MKILGHSWFYKILLFTIVIAACSESNPTTTELVEEPVEDPVFEADATVSVSLNQVHQTMIGFGGALTWNSRRITDSSKKDEIVDIIADDLGMDILRLKNWYYPVGYPENKEPDAMVIDWHKPLFDATNELYDLIIGKNPDIEVLFSSWGPHNSLKSNDRLFRGTLKKQDGEFMYDEFATYWNDVLNHISFKPDYLSIQNEPTWVADWETCKWRPTETEEFPSYEIAFDKVAENLSKLENPPILVGPESANLSFESFDAFAVELQDNPNLGVYGYHPYNFRSDTPLSEIQAVLAELGQNFNDKPLMMTEYDGLEWMKTARFINSTMRDANTAAYIYWKLMWDENSEEAMIQVDENGNYELTKFYYLMKHYSKFVDEGYVRVDVSTDDTSLDLVAFLSPDGNSVTVISINPSASELLIQFSVDGRTIVQGDSYQSLENDPYNTIDGVTDEVFNLRGESITTTVLELN
jgi:glucuronoarabinoxylan endo-1,4-beta-xylanase